MDTKVVTDLVRIGKNRFPQTAMAKFASGQCWSVSEDLVWGFSGNMHIVYAENSSDVHTRWLSLGQYGNHYALKLDNEDKVIDFTLRQFDDTVDWPFIGTTEEWLAVLRKAWEAEPRYTDEMCACLSYPGGYYCECDPDLL